MRVIPDRSVLTSPADPTRFTGRVWRTDYIDPDDLEHLAGSRFLYEPGVPHWHGATPSTAFAHLAITAGGTTTWLHEVADDDYLR